MTFEETVEMLFQPGMFEVFVLGMSLVIVVLFFSCLICCLGELFMCLIHRFIWPGKKPEEKEALNE